MFIDGTTANVPALARTILMTVDATGGVLTYALSLASELAKAGTKIHFAMLGPKPKPEQLAAIRGIPQAVLHEHAGALEWMDDPWADVARASSFLRDLEQQVRPDIVHLNGYCHGSAGFRAPIIIVAHDCMLSRADALGESERLEGRAGLGDAPPEGEPVPCESQGLAKYTESTKRGLAAATAVIAVSQTMRVALERHYGPLPRIAVIPNGLAVEASSREKEELVVCAGRTWDRARNVETLVRVAAELPWPLEIAGDPAPRGVGDGVSFDGRDAVADHGWMSPSDLGVLLDRAAIFASPARHDPFGMSALEAALRGCALVLGDIPSARELWGDAARFVRPDDERGLVEAISELASDEESRDRLAAEANLRARLYTPARNARVMSDLYETMIQARRIPLPYLRGPHTKTV